MFTTAYEYEKHFYEVYSIFKFDHFLSGMNRETESVTYTAASHEGEQWDGIHAFYSLWCRPDWWGQVLILQDRTFMFGSSLHSLNLYLRK